jgi:hypothetical protein
MGNTFIKGSIFKEVFDKYSPKLGSKQADLDSDEEPEQIMSEDQEVQEQEEKTFLEEQRTSSKNSKGSSSKQSKKASHKNSSGSSDGILKTVEEHKDPKAEEETKEAYPDSRERPLNPFSLLFHTSRPEDQTEKEFLDTREINILDLDFLKIPGSKARL